MKIKKTEYKISLTIRDTFQVCKITSYFGISWVGEYVGGEFYDLPSASSFVNRCKARTIEIKGS
jgi:hypothetical protein